MINEVKRLKLEHPDWGRRRIAKELGISERQVRKHLEKCNTASQQCNNRTVTYQAGMLHIDDKVALTTDDLLSPEAIMTACGIDPMKFEIVTFQHSEWDGMAKIDDEMQTKRLYAIKLKVKPKKNGFDLQACLEMINSTEIKQYTFMKTEPSGSGLIEVFPTDMHFGINTLEEYSDTLQGILGLLEGHDSLVLVTGSDNLHTNGHKGQTVNGTQLEQIDLNKAFNDAVEFYTRILTRALNLGMNVRTVHVPANHDYDTSFFVAKTLERMFPQVEVDTDMNQYKAMRYGQTAIGWTHGDEGRNFDRVFMREFPEIFGTAETLEVHTGHLHMETVQDQAGVLVRTLPTRTKRTDWTKRKGYHSVRRFQVFSYTEDGLRAIYYV